MIFYYVVVIKLYDLSKVLQTQLRDMQKKADILLRRVVAGNNITSFQQYKQLKNENNQLKNENNNEGYNFYAKNIQAKEDIEKMEKILPFLFNLAKK